MSRGKKKPLLSVAQVFNKCQEGVSGHSKYSKILWDVQEAEPEKCWNEFLFCLEHLLALPESNTHVERALRFVATFTSQRPSGRQEAGDAFVEDVLTHLVSLAEAEDKVVRLRVCQLLQLIINNQADEEAALSEDLADSLLETMLARLRDKQPAIRCQAALALARLADPGEAGDFGGDAVTASYLKLLLIEKNKDVRKAVLHSLSAARCSLPEILNRTRDISDEVRKMAYAAVRDRVPLEFLSLEQRACLIRRGLGDRKPAVRDCAVALMCHWLNEDAGGSVPSLLRLLDVHNAEEEAEQVLLALIECGRLQPAALTEEATEGDPGLRRAPGSEPMPDEVALMWRIFCTWLQDEGTAKGRAAAAASGAVASVEAARASDALEALEAMLPVAAEELMGLVAVHAAADGSGFAARQLLTVAARCVNLSDAAGRAAAGDLVQSILTDGGAAPAKDRAMAVAVMRLAAQVAGSPSELAALTLDAVAQCLHLDDSAPQAASPEDRMREEDCWLHSLNLASVLLEGTPLKGQRPVATNPALTCLADIGRRLVIPAMDMGPAVRAEAVRCTGLLCMLADGCDAAAAADCAQRIALLRTAFLADPGAAVREAAAKALCDLAVLRGTTLLDQRYTPLLDHPSEMDANPAAIEEASLPVLDVLLGRLASAGGRGASEDDYAVVSAVAEGLAKLLLHQQLPGRQHAPLQDAETHKVLAQLLVLACDPGLAAAARMQQCLTVFFHAYAPQSAAAQGRLCAAALPAARRALLAGLTPAKSAAPQLLRYVLSLLQMETKGDEAAGDSSSNGHVRLAEDALKEALACPAGQAFKPFIAALLKLANGLSLNGATQEDVKRIKVLAKRAAEGLKDRLAAKDAAALAQRLSGLDQTPDEGLSEEALQALLASVEEMGVAAKALFEAAAAAPPSPRGGRPARGRGAAKPAAGGRRRRAAPSESKDEESSDSTEDDGSDSGAEEQETALTDSNTAAAAATATTATDKRTAMRKASTISTRRGQQENVAPMEC
ncbi:probable condensin complex subunit 3 at N-terminal half [Coccomyxa sp. Obi]|nr:probable condensin complex subunit 3 at N-terminal half [Coccomyxa sp. Obi]